MSLTEFRTPNGRSALMRVRDGTSDHNTVSACLDGDEYGFRGRSFGGVALDIGAHIGGATVALGLDNPDLRIIAVEPVPPNAELLRQNVAGNGLTDRVTVIEGVVGGRKPVSVWYGYRGNENDEHHAFIGNSTLAYNRGGPVKHDTVRYQTPWTLRALVEMAGGSVSLVKIDCEGGEWSFLDDVAVGACAEIIGEWHPVRDHVRSDVCGLLQDTHFVTYSGPVAGPGGFVAVHR